MHKVGDKILCKKDEYYFDGKIFYKDKYYLILKKNNNNFIIIDEDGDPITFGKDETFNNGGFRDFNDYFYTPDEIRKLKLKKLQCL